LITGFHKQFNFINWCLWVNRYTQANLFRILILSCNAAFNSVD